MTKPQTPRKRTTVQTVHTEESLLARTEEVGHCMEWQGYLEGGNPAVCHQGKMIMVRRLLLNLRGVDIPAGSYVATKCDNPLCVHPDHIKIRTRSQHAAAMSKNVSQNSVVRVRKLMDFARENRAKLSMQQAMEIRASSEPASVLQKRYPVSKSRINRIKNGEAWRDLSSPFAGLMT